MLDILIVGGGPAALTAGLYGQRAGLSTKIIEKEALGGQIADSPKVENFPAQEAISGLNLIDKMLDQYTSFGGDVEMDEILSVKKDGGVFVSHGKYADYESKTVIIAAGVKHRRLGIEGEDRLLGKGVSYCAVCDGPFYKGKDVVVIGDSSSALQYALMLSEICHHVTICTLFEGFFAEDCLIKAIGKKENISVYHCLNSVRFNGESALKSITFKDTKTGEEKDIGCDAAFVAVGQKPDNDRFLPLIDEEKGFIKADDSTMRTKTPGLFAAGDCRIKKIRQLTTACADGAIAALSASEYIQKLQS